MDAIGVCGVLSPFWLLDVIDVAPDEDEDEDDDDDGPTGPDAITACVGVGFVVVGGKGTVGKIREAATAATPSAAPAAAAADIAAFLRISSAWIAVSSATFAATWTARRALK